MKNKPGDWVVWVGIHNKMTKGKIYKVVDIKENIS